MYFTFEMELSFLQETNLMAYIRRTEEYLSGTDPFSLSDRGYEKYCRREECLLQAKKIYNQYVKDGDFISYRGKPLFDI